MNEKNNLKHSLTLDGRKTLTLWGVSEVYSSCEKQVLLNTGAGKLKISGTDLSIGKLNTETGELSLTGTVNLLEYKENKSQGGFISSVFK